MTPRVAGKQRTARPYWNMGVERKLGSKTLEALRLKRLKQVLGFVDRYSEFHASRFSASGVDPLRIRSFDQFRKTVPLFTKEDQRSAQEESIARHGHAFGTTLCVPIEDIRLTCATSGTTGEPTFYLFSERDLDVWCEGRARAFWRAGLRPGMRILIGFGLGMFVGGVPNVLAAQRFGLGVVPVGAEGGATRILKFARLTRPHALMGTPSLAEHLIEKAPESIGCEVGQLELKVLMLGGEPGVGIPAVRSKLEKAYGARVFDLQGPNMSCDHRTYNGLHRLMDDYYFYELVDPETKEPLEMNDGAVGELVTTQLWPGAGPFIRYTAGDLQQIHTEPCPCGLSGFRSRIIGRTDDMMKVKGVIVYPSAIKEVIESFQPRTTGEFRIVLDQPPPRVDPPLRLKIETNVEMPGMRDSISVGARHAVPSGRARHASPLQDLDRKLRDAFHSRLKFTPEIEWVPPTSLPRSDGKKGWFEKHYRG